MPEVKYRCSILVWMRVKLMTSHYRLRGMTTVFIKLTDESGKLTDSFWIWSRCSSYSLHLSLRLHPQICVYLWSHITMKKGPRIARANTDRVWTERGKPSRDNITAVMLKKIRLICSKIQKLTFKSYQKLRHDRRRWPEESSQCFRIKDFKQWRL